jgi:hypothetical protein
MASAPAASRSGSPAAVPLELYGGYEQAETSDDGECSVEPSGDIDDVVMRAAGFALEEQQNPASIKMVSCRAMAQAQREAWTVRLMAGRAWAPTKVRPGPADRSRRPL